MASLNIVWRRNLGRLLFAAAVGVCIWAAWPRSAVVRAAPAEGDSSPPPSGTPDYVGVSSCASVACHNAKGPAGTKMSEYSTWAHDKHADAYSVLLAQRSKLIERNLHPGMKTKAEEDGLCLKCHGPTAQVGGQGTSPGPENTIGLPGEYRTPPYGFFPSSQSDGVSCESCHGPAGKWLTVHYQAGWKSMSPAEKQKLGFVDTRNVLGQVHECVKCHVGVPGQEVNHDLMAAGHPRLNFEFGAYLAVMPAHWDIREERSRWAQDHPGEMKDARLWAIGEVVVANAAIDLLVSRAERAQAAMNPAPWPEFTEYDCYACHHDLQARSTRQASSYYKGRTPGQIPYGDWYLSTPRSLAKTSLLAAPEGVEKALADLVQSMNKPYPPPNEVVEQAKKASADLGKWLEKVENVKYNPSTAQGLVDALTADAQESPSWDVAAQRYVALASLSASLKPEQRGEKLKEMLGRARTLTFPKGFESPRPLIPLIPASKE